MSKRKTIQDLTRSSIQTQSRRISPQIERSRAPKITSFALGINNFISAHWVAITVIIFIFGILSRFVLLSDRVFYHDESLYSYYAWTEATSHPHTYSHVPLLHGPLQMQIMAGVFMVASALHIIGNGDAAARFHAAFAAILLFIVVWRMRRELGREGIIVGLVLLALSPSIWYYQRFCRNESHFILLSLLIGISAARAWRSAHPGGWIIAFCLFVATLIADKANSLFLLFNGFWFVILLAIYELVRRRMGLFVGLSPTGTFLHSLRRHIWAWIIGISLAFLLLNVVCTNGFDKTWPNKNFFSMYKEILVYWWGQHKEHRLYGEFHYYMPIMVMYDLFVSAVLVIASAIVIFGKNVLRKTAAFVGAVLLFAIASSAFASQNTGATAILAGIVALIIAIGLAVFACRWNGKGTYWKTVPLFVFVLGGYSIAAFGDQFFGNMIHSVLGTLLSPPDEKGASILKDLHMSMPWHLALTFGVSWVTFVGTLEALFHRRKFRAWLVWWTGLSFLQYSYAGEKVPWVVLHIMLPAIILTADLAASWWRNNRQNLPMQRLAVAGFCVVCLLNLVQGTRVVFFDTTNPGELIVFNSSQPAIKEIGRKMRQAAVDSEGKEKSVLSGAATWPLVWYMHGYTYQTSTAGEQWKSAPYAVYDIPAGNGSLEPSLLAHYNLEKVDFRWAWQPRFAPLHLLSSYEQEKASFDAKEEAAREKSREAGAPMEDIGPRPREELCGVGAWGTLFTYLVTRKPWAAEQTAVPMQVYSATRKDIPTPPTPPREGEIDFGQ